jgi:hypothetical protein
MGLGAGLLATYTMCRVCVCVCVCVCVGGGDLYQGSSKRLQDRALIWAPRYISMMILSYQVLLFPWCVLVAHLAARTDDSVIRRVQTGRKPEAGG